MNHTPPEEAFLSEGTIAINATNYIIIKIPKTPVKLRTGKISRLTTPKIRGKRLEYS
jgi:hypothetical protein